VAGVQWWIEPRRRDVGVELAEQVSESGDFDLVQGRERRGRSGIGELRTLGKLPAFVGQHDDLDASIGGVLLAEGQISILESVEQRGDIGVVASQAPGQLSHGDYLVQGKDQKRSHRRERKPRLSGDFVEGGHRGGVVADGADPPPRFIRRILFDVGLAPCGCATGHDRNRTFSLSEKMIDNISDSVSVFRVGVRRNQQLVVAIVYLAAMFMAIMDTTIVNVALPALGRNFRVPPGEVGLVSIAYLVSLTVFIPASGWFGDLVGGRRALLAAIGVFTVGSTLCGLATNLDELIAFRVVQGLGGAVMTPVGLAMLFRVYPPAERVRVSSVLSVFTALAPALGPILGGLFTTYVSWRLVFFVNVPIGIAVLVFGAVSLDDHTPPHPGRLDIAGLILSGLGLGTFMYAISEGSTQGWAAPTVLGALCGGAGLLVAMVTVELREANPLVDLRLFTNRLFAASTSLYALGSVAYLGALFLAALLFQDALRLSAVQSGLAVFPSALGVMAGSQIVTRVLYGRFGPRRLVVTGLPIIAAALILIAQVDSGTSLWVVRLIMFALGIGVSFVFIPNQAASMATITRAQTGRASAIFNAGKQLGGAVGVALLTTVLTVAGPTQERAGHLAANLSGYHDGFLAAATVALISIPVACTIRDADAVATMAPGNTSGRGRSVRQQDLESEAS
jgi:EmrB/QacA subfamily drug resistance transporter